MEYHIYIVVFKFKITNEYTDSIPGILLILDKTLLFMNLLSQKKKLEPEFE